ncbi:exonuclease SbcC [Nocardia sp. CDC159]|uniref:Exonuclease SbcC n=1 Tax=Nocardia pulmonis TaxID=2951408 RepID=A0A9X2J1I1_9NOCA|nr:MULTISPECIES: exonuclease SbcC [Nocardia]MCM6777041.1 exonuclease SbcC [Nocardia pulmonis]MCM6789465.1 exonuclease SbcC [Nocardia sp. CDC159]
MTELPLSIDERRTATDWAADCAERVLPLFETAAPGDARPREAIAGAREYVRDGERTARLRTLAWAAFAAAREIGDPAATAAARAAQCAVAVPYIHPLATPHQSKHLLGPAVYAALARESAADGDAAAARAELRWAAAHAPSEVREVLRRFPPRAPGRTRQVTLFHELDLALRG